jgi:hypothetical protein
MATWVTAGCRLRYLPMDSRFRSTPESDTRVPNDAGSAYQERVALYVNCFCSPVSGPSKRFVRESLTKLS